MDSGSTSLNVKLHDPPPEEVAAVQHPPSIFGAATGNVTRKEISKAPERAFLLEGVFSRDECAHYIRTTEAIGYKSLENSFPSGYRSNDRLINIDKKAAEAIFTRIVPSFTADDCRATPIGPASDGIWIPYGLNEGMKFCRYRPGCKFAAHMDSPWTPETHIQSIYTLVIYLNDDFTGGETNFLQAPTSTSEQSELQRSREPHTVLCQTTPVTGAALLFKHQLLHEGAELKSGTKYILRTEVLFRRLPSVLEMNTLSTIDSNPVMQAIQKLYTNSEIAAKENGGSSEKFVEEYLKALRLQQQHTTPTPAPALYGRLPRDVLLLVFQRLRLPDLLRVMQCSRTFFRLARDPELWRRLFQRRYLDIWDAQKNKSLSVDWFAEFRSHYFTLLKAGSPKFIVHVRPEITTCAISLKEPRIRSGVSRTYQCPYCKQTDLPEGPFVAHCLQNHRSTENPRVVCPICAAREGGDPNFVSSHFFSHLALRHGGQASGFISCLSFCEDYHSIVSEYVETHPGFGHWGSRIDHIYLIRPLGGVMPAPPRDTLSTKLETLCEQSTLFGLSDEDGEKRALQPEAVRTMISALFQRHCRRLSGMRQYILIVPDIGFASDQMRLQVYNLMRGEDGLPTRIVTHSAAVLRLHGLSNGVVVCLEDTGFGFVTLVIDSECIRTTDFGPEITRDPLKIAALVKGIVRGDELSYAGYNVVLTGKLIADEHERYEKMSHDFRANLAKTSLKSVPSDKSTAAKDIESQKKLHDIHQKDADILMALRMPDPRELTGQRLKIALNMYALAYRVLSSTHALRDAVEGAARLNLSAVLLLKRPQRVVAETLIPPQPARVVEMGQKNAKK